MTMVVSSDAPRSVNVVSAAAVLGQFPVRHAAAPGPLIGHGSQQHELVRPLEREVAKQRRIDQREHRVVDPDPQAQRHTAAMVKRRSLISSRAAN